MTAWTVLNHGDLEELDVGLWRVEGTVPKQPLGRSMVVVRCADGGLLIHNPICLNEAGMEQLDALGPVRWIVVPCGLHRLDPPSYKERYPAAQVLCPAGARERIQAKVAVDGLCADFPNDPSICLEPLRGTASAELVMWVQRNDQTTVVLADAVFNLPHQPGLSGLVTRWLGSSGGPRVTRLARWILIKDAPALATHLHELADLPGLTRVVVAHRDMITEAPSATLHQVASSI